MYPRMALQLNTSPRSYGFYKKFFVRSEASLRAEDAATVPFGPDTFSSNQVTSDTMPLLSANFSTGTSIICAMVNRRLLR